MSLADLWTYWKSFWFAPEPVLPLCVFRILFGLIVLAYCALLYPDLLNWFGTHALCSPQTSEEVLWSLGATGINVLKLLPPGDSGVLTLFWILCLAALGLTFGCCTRLSAICVYLAIAAFQQADSLIINGGDILLKMAAFVLMFSAAGERLSVDSCWARRNTRASSSSDADNKPAAARTPSGWPQRLYRFQIALIYFQAFWSKLEDTSWLNGSAIYYVLREQEFLRFPVPWISHSISLCQALSWGSLAIEGAMWSLVWFKETRYFVIAGMLIFHLGIEYTMNLPIFEWLMMASLVMFVPAVDLETALARLQQICLSPNTGKQKESADNQGLSM